MADQPRKKGRVENRPVTASARATHDQPDDNELEKGVTRHTWKKRPRTFDWVLNASAPGGAVSINLLRGYRGHVACDIWENNVSFR
ncbi:SsrA-binding protein [Bienertia sinuspersici]